MTVRKRSRRYYTDRIYDFEWCDDFSAARNFAFSKGTKDFLMWLDADDVIPREEAERFRSFKENAHTGYGCGDDALCGFF